MLLLKTTTTAMDLPLLHPQQQSLQKLYQATSSVTESPSTASNTVVNTSAAPAQAQSVEGECAPETGTTSVSNSGSQSPSPSSTTTTVTESVPVTVTAGPSSSNTVVTTSAVPVESVEARMRSPNQHHDNYFAISSCTCN